MQGNEKYEYLKYTREKENVELCYLAACSFHTERLEETLRLHRVMAEAVKVLQLADSVELLATVTL